MIDKDIIMRADDFIPGTNFPIEQKGCVLVLPGRGVSGNLMERFMLHVGLWRSFKFILEPRNLEWYPAPNGPEDQVAAAGGLEKARGVLENEIKRIERAFGFKKKEMVIIGFSAGSVMAIQMLAHSDEPYAGVLSLAGAILEPEKLPKSKHNTPICIQHNKDDDCFKWDERYLPMKQALTEKGYNAKFCEGEEGGHNITGEECDLTRAFVSGIFDYRSDYDIFEKMMIERRQKEEEAAEASGEHCEEGCGCHHDHEEE